MRRLRLWLRRWQAGRSWEARMLADLVQYQIEREEGRRRRLVALNVLKREGGAR